MAVTFMSFELWFYAGILIMILAGLAFLVQAVLFAAKRADISRRLDEEYGQPQKYNIKEEGERIWP